jgi:hypothetical protein
MMKKNVLIILFLVTKLAFAQTEKYRLIINDDPDTTATIGWNEPASPFGGSTLFYDTIDHGTNVNDYTNSQDIDRETISKGMFNKFVRLKNLQPNTAYYFVLGNTITGASSDRFWFKTLPQGNSRLSFVSGGDSRSDGVFLNEEDRIGRINANNIVAKIKPHAIFFGGDMTNFDTDAEWDIWFNDWQLTISSDNQLFGIVATRGNHELDTAVIYNLFDVPNENAYYALTFGDNLIRAYTLNTEISIAGDQTDWLRADLENNTNDCWRMAQYHKPIRAHQSGKAEGDAQYANWAQLFYDFNVRLVIECDSHVVKTTFPLKPDVSGEQGFSIDEAAGTYFLGEGTWGAPTRANDDDKSWTAASGSFNQIKWMFVDCEKIEIRTIKTDNANEVGIVLDQFTPPSNIDLWNPASIGEVLTIQDQNVLSTEDFIIYQYEIYPNPFSEKLTISVPKEVDYLQITAYNILGKKIFNSLQNTINGQVVINTETFDSGPVFLYIANADGKIRAVKKLVKY